MFFLGRRQHGDREVPTHPVDMICTNKGSLCQFPYKLRGKVSQFYIQKMNSRDMDVFLTKEIWGCMDDDKGQSLCPGAVLRGKILPEFDDLSTFRPCQH